jgi:hypothetical protein
LLYSGDKSFTSEKKFRVKEGEEKASPSQEAMEMETESYVEQGSPEREVEN